MRYLSIVALLLFTLSACSEDGETAERSSQESDTLSSDSASGSEVRGGVVPPTSSTSQQPGDTRDRNGTSVTGSSTTEEPASSHVSSDTGDTWVEPDDRPDGAPCLGDVQCAGGTCLEDPEWPDGHCTTIVCLDRDDCARSAEDDSTRCLQSRGPLRNYCVVLCESSGECREGYECSPLDEDVGYCAPSSREVEPEDNHRPTGAACSTDQNCIGGTCLDGERFPEGFCTLTGCQRAEDCGDGETDRYECVETDDGAFCAPSCQSNADCRSGYICIDDDAGAGRYCGLPENIGEIEASQPDGESCELDAECLGGTCLRDPDWPRGYCTTLGCVDRDDCQSPNGEDNRCLQQRQAQNYCVRICDSAAQCRSDYRCQPIGSVGYCSPRPPESDTGPVDHSGSALAIECGIPATNGTASFLYDVAVDSWSWMVVPFNPEGQGMIAQRLFFRDGSQLDLGDSENAFLTTTAEILGFTNPILLPPLATRQELRESSQSCPGGAEVCDDLGNSMSVETNSSSICAYVAERDAPGTRLDMNVYLVDLPGFDADMVQDSPVFQRFWEDVDEILAGADLEVGEVRYREFEPEIAEAYGVVRRTSDVQALARATELPGETLDEQLSINIFMTRGFSFQGGGAIGISLGIPGPAGLHGSSASGVALTAEFLGRAFTRGGSRVDGNKYTAQILVHEIGHFLGLFHTTEQDQLNTDPIEDTPSCPRNFNFPNQCPDRQNLMFPLAGVGNVTISEGQSFVMQANPLTAP